MSKFDSHGNFGKFPPSDARRAQPEEPDRHRKEKKKRKESARPHRGQRRGFLLNFAAHTSANLGSPNSRPRCYMKPVLHVRHDAYYCPKCLIWLENKCEKTKECATCKGRTSVEKALEEDEKESE